MKKIPITNVSSVWSSGAFVMNLPVQEFGWLSWRDHPAGGFRRTRQTLVSTLKYEKKKYLFSLFTHLPKPSWRDYFKFFYSTQTQ